MADKRCVKCTFWTETCANCDNGICNRYPQTVEKNYMESCGEWKPREKQELPSRPCEDRKHRQLTHMTWSSHPTITESWYTCSLIDCCKKPIPEIPEACSCLKLCRHYGERPWDCLEECSIGPVPEACPYEDYRDKKDVCQSAKSKGWSFC